MKILKCDKCGNEYEKTIRLDEGYDCCRTAERQITDASEMEIRLSRSVREFISGISHLCPECKKKLTQQTYLMFEFLTTQEEK